MHHKFVVFPFSAIVGQELMKKALMVVAIDPTVGGVLIKGEKGTAKSTAVRALADILPKIKVVEGCPFNCDPENLRLMCKSCQERYEEEGSLPYIERKMEVVDMPLSATEDMVIGTIDIKRALKEGIKALETGILAKANRNILYIDEVNLLDDHLVNILLDAAAMGVNIVEREGISVYHPARFILVGTMNPEEGDLRPQILDRFGLCVEVKALSSKEERLKVMEYRRKFDLYPWKFEEEFRESQEMLRNKILVAKQKISEVRVSSDLLEKIVEITISLGIKSHRADIVMEKTSKVLAILDSRDEVNEEDIKEAALLALSHRIRQSPFDKTSTLKKDTIETILKQKTKEEIFDFDKDIEIKNKILNFDEFGKTYGKESLKINSEKGIYIKAKEAEDPKSVAVDATIRKAVRETGELKILPEHIMEKIRVAKAEALYVIVIDSSSSMRMDKKIRFAKSLVWQLLKRSYENKNKVALMCFREEETKLLVPPTTDVSLLYEELEKLPTGGKTPLTPALYKSFEIAKKETKATPVVILISDGKGNVFIKNNLKEDIEFLSSIADDTKLILINTENKTKSIGILEEIAEKFNAEHYYLEDII